MGLSEGFFIIKNYKTKMNKEQIDQIIDRKEKQISKKVCIFGPDDGLESDLAADWLTSLLCQMYVQHGITKNQNQLLLDIESGNCRPWFAVKDGLPVASAALIKQADGSVEIGRAVSIENGVGGLLMLLAVADHLSSSTGPIVAEVRVSGQFLGIPSGEATQTICFKHLGLKPQALAPAFNHGEPNRQEMFLFSSSHKIESREPVFLPSDRASVDLIAKTAIALATGGIQKELKVRISKEPRSRFRWGIVFLEPFSLVVPESGGSKLETVIDAVESRSPFTLISLPTDDLHAPAIIECLEAGFVPCGFDRNLDSNGHMVLLLGKLRKGTLLAPVKLISDLLEDRTILAINTIDEKFRSQSTTKL